MVMIVNLRRDLNDRVANSDGMTRARREVAARIAEDASRRSRVSRARGTFRAEVDPGNPPRVAAVAGNKKDKSFIVVFEELGGSGFRPPPAPMRTAAERFGNVGAT